MLMTFVITTLGHVAPMLCKDNVSGYFYGNLE